MQDDALLINIKIDGTNPKCVSAQKQVKKAMTSENINILNPMIILFWAVSVIAPVFDSVYRSINHAD